MRHVQNLKKQGLLERIGSNKAGYWIIKGNTDDNGANEPIKLKNEPINEPINEFIIWNIIKENPSISYDAIIKKTGRSRATIMRHVQNLKKQGLLERIGSNKTGYWKINANKNG